MIQDGPVNLQLWKDSFQSSFLLLIALSKGLIRCNISMLKNFWFSSVDSEVHTKEMKENASANAAEIVDVQGSPVLQGKMSRNLKPF